MAKVKALDPLKIRLAHEESQSVFWKRLGCTQSGGSRYENGRALPGPLRLLLRALHIGVLSKEQLESLAKK